MQLINNKEKYCIDILSSLINKFNFIETDYKIRENIVEVLGKSQDKKAIEILLSFLQDKSNSVMEKAINSIGALDVEYLIELFDTLYKRREIKVQYINTLISYYKEGTSILDKIDLSELISSIEVETDDNIKTTEIRLLLFLYMRCK
jgi:hypothetical protein